MSVLCKGAPARQSDGRGRVGTFEPRTEIGRSQADWDPSLNLAFLCLEDPGEGRISSLPEGLENIRGGGNVIQPAHCVAQLWRLQRALLCDLATGGPFQPIEGTEQEPGAIHQTLRATVLHSSPCSLATAAASSARDHTSQCLGEKEASERG